MLTGVLLAGGLVLLVGNFLPQAPRLQPAVERVVGSQAPHLREPELIDVSRPSERLGAWLFRHSPVPLTGRQRQSLKLQGKSVAEFYADKIVMMLVGAAIPAAISFAFLLLTGRLSLWPAAFAVAGAGVGYLVPDLLLRRKVGTARSGAIEALLVYLDLVTLERLANASATQALQQAAELSDAPLFAQIRIALERAHLEQQSPYGELRRLADQLDLPELNDVADVMQLDETGSALSGTLRARVKELRDAHLTRERVLASAAAEGMTIYMTLPALIFGLIFLVAALLTLLGTAA
jgi:tight adherence protein C